MCLGMCLRICDITHLLFCDTLQGCPWVINNCIGATAIDVTVDKVFDLVHEHFRGALVDHSYPLKALLVILLLKLFLHVQSEVGGIPLKDFREI